MHSLRPYSAKKLSYHAKCMLFAGLLTGDASPQRFAFIVTLAVILEEAVRWWLYTIHRCAEQENLQGRVPILCNAILCCCSVAGWILQASGTPSGFDSIEELQLALQFG